MKENKGGMPQQETMDDFKNKALERVRAEREKLDQFGRIG